MSFNSNQDDEVMSEINMTPLVDIMLVLLIIFIITIPVINHAVKLELPAISHQVNDIKPVHINLAIDAAGEIHWEDEVITQTALVERVAAAAKLQPQPEIHLRADRQTPYEKVARVMVTAQAGGLSKIGFVTDPEITP